MNDFEMIRRQLDERLAPPRQIPIEPERVPQAAVSLILRDAQGSAQTLIIKRAERPGDHWSGHLALPGGRAQIEDGDLIATAARETYEEVGIDCSTAANSSAISKFWLRPAGVCRGWRSRLSSPSRRLSSR